ncbi:MAG: hypothetical protein KTR15_04775 [Phycisphaeraceae bacterium]|nr:hypothetical protein [Phycisphaeraceae bacterium]
MNLNPNQPDETIDEALLDEALSEATPAELEAKILALTDPAMLSLLDEAMAPESPGDQLTQRILAATRDNMQPGTVPTPQPAHEAGVLARIGPSTIRYAAAAAILLAIGLGIWFANQTPGPTTPPITGNGGTPGVANDETTDPDWLVDEQLASDADYFGGTTEPIEGVLEDAANSLEDMAITRDTLWADLDAYEAFLDEIES